MLIDGVGASSADGAVIYLSTRSQEVFRKLQRPCWKHVLNRNSFAKSGLTQRVKSCFMASLELEQQQQQQQRQQLLLKIRV
jgi:hypothetical protein